jgi:hypothetical protein
VPNMVRQSQLTDQGRDRWRLPLERRLPHFDIRRVKLGFGLTLIAANKIGRVCRGVELDPLYIDGIVRRFEAATGNQTVLIRIGGAFDVFAERRSREAAPITQTQHS